MNKMNEQEKEYFKRLTDQLEEEKKPKDKDKFKNDCEKNDTNQNNESE